MKGGIAFGARPSVCAGRPHRRAAAAHRSATSPRRLMADAGAALLRLLFLLLASQLRELAAELALEHVAQSRDVASLLPGQRLELLGRGARADVAHGQGDASIHRVDVRHLGLDLVAGAERRVGVRFAGRDEGLDALRDAHEGAVLNHRQHGGLGHERSRLVVVQHRGPGVVPELLDAERDLLLVVVDAEDDGLDLVALVVEVGRVVDLDGPGQVGLVDHAVDAVFDADEDAVVGDAADLAGDLVAGLVLVGEQRPGIGLELLQAQADALGLARRPRAPGTRSLGRPPASCTGA